MRFSKKKNFFVKCWKVLHFFVSFIVIICCDKKKMRSKMVFVWDLRKNSWDLKSVVVDSLKYDTESSYDKSISTHTYNWVSNLECLVLYKQADCLQAACIFVNKCEAVSSFNDSGVFQIWRRQWHRSPNATIYDALCI